jgi:hypothetical protein
VFGNVSQYAKLDLHLTVLGKTFVDFVTANHFVEFEIPAFGEVIPYNGDFQSSSLNRVIFASENHLKQVDGFGFGALWN